jgi:pyruvate dehydrogenase E1 component
VFSIVFPNCQSYNPAFNYELVLIVLYGLEQFSSSQKDSFYYVTLTNEVTPQEMMPKDVGGEVINGLYCKRFNHEVHLQIVGSGSVLFEALKAQSLLEVDWKVDVNVWCSTSFTRLAREDLTSYGVGVNSMNKTNRESYIQRQIQRMKGPVIAVSDFTRVYPEQLRPAMTRNNKYYLTLGTDGFGRSDSRCALRDFFKVSVFWIIYFSLKALCVTGALHSQVLMRAIKKYRMKTPQNLSLFE